MSKTDFQSGTMINPWASKNSEMMESISLKLLQKLNCTELKSIEIDPATAVPCIQSKATHLIQVALVSYYVSAFPKKKLAKSPLVTHRQRQKS